MALLGRKNKRPQWMVDEKAVFDDLQRVQLPALFGMYGVNCVIDVGAHEGEYAKRLRAGGYAGRIVSFEPVPRAFAELEQAAAGDPDWHVHAVALGREDGTTTMNVVPGTLSSILPATKFGAGRTRACRTGGGRGRGEAPRPDARRAPGRDRRAAPVPEARHAGFDLDVFAGAGDTIRRSSACSPSSR